MPNQRGENQKLVNFQASERFIELLNCGVKLSESVDRSKFIRDAIVERLGKLDIHVPVSVKNPPSRIGKGGAKSAPLTRPATKTKYPPASKSSAVEGLLDDAGSKRYDEVVVSTSPVAGPPGAVSPGTSVLPCAPKQGPCVESKKKSAF